MASLEVRQGDIFWADIPPGHTVGSEQYKRRPYVIVSRDHLNRGSTVVGVPLTTQGVDGLQTGHPPHRILIPAREISRDIAFTGDIKDSVAKTDQVRVLAKERLDVKMGQLSRSAVIAVGLGLAYLLDLR